MPLPDGFEFIQDSNGDLLFLIQTSDENQAGEYTIEFEGSIDEGPQAGTLSTFRFTAIVQDDSNVETNTPAIFVTDLPPRVDATGGEDNFTFDLPIPETFDAEGDNVEITFDYGSWTGWLKYDEELRKVVPDRREGNNFDFVPAVDGFIQITLTDDN